MRKISWQLAALTICLSLTLFGFGGPDINTAAELGMAEKLREAIDQGADVNKRGKNANTPLHSAVWKDHIDCVRILLDHHADVNAVNGDDSRTPLHIAAALGSTEIARLLLESGANVDPIDKNGRTPLYLAAARDQAKVVLLLLEKGADIDGRSKNRNGTPLAVAKRTASVKALRVLRSAYNQR
ncbi:hypothetical protein DSCA_08100 [Desulfosarcina alkanivorans]|jgi:ankyrin repeat protein|uniref:Uncharacterized protein n=1 Tax=Desulfosarcina alkanivorans TaxID=571177 RepID=A0A5K7YFR1_9BACT|nr:ankyrin repeat domain-containing protein [Desulfosarcina alkanivorans]BBO66880.1 hypothetical protein DSCA_08100 [Desulfosarcina alkanivorans]